MFKKRNQVIVEDTGKVSYAEFSLSKDLTKNIEMMRQIFKNDDTVIFRQFKNQSNPSIQCYAVFIDGMTDTYIINEHIVKPITESEIMSPNDIEPKIIWGNEVTKSSKIDELVKALLYGDTLIFIDKIDEVIIMNSKGFEVRSITEPDDERVLRGPREGFTESIMVNLSLIRRKIQTSDLKFSYQTFGTRTNTKACICYLDSLVDKRILKDLENRLQQIEQSRDGYLNDHYIEELIRDSPYSIFKTTGSTEKPDVVAAKLLEGRIALVMDGTPIVLTVPYLFIENFQSADDYYTSFYYASVGRLMRLASFIFTVSISAIYVSLVAFHKEMIPTPFLLSIASATRGVPFPDIVEIFILTGMFEVLREAGVRMPNKVGQALSIVGALVIGQSAVEAKIISAPMVIVVAISGITGLMVPRLAGAVIVLRLIALMSAAFLGLFGYFFFLIGLTIYLVQLQSFGVSQTSGFLSSHLQGLKDIYIRAPQKFLNTRPTAIAVDQERSEEA